MNNLKIDGRKSLTTVECKNNYELVISKESDKTYTLTTIQNGMTSKAYTLASGINKDQAQKIANDFIINQVKIEQKKDNKAMAKKVPNKQKVNVIIDPKTLARVDEIKAKAKAQNNIVMLSDTSKLGVKSWSLQALNTCPASVDSKGNLVDACSGCYATGGNYRFSNVKAVREYNKQVWQNEDFVNDFVAKLDNERYFRWFDSGDLYSLSLAKKIYEIMLNTPHVKHWMPTRMHKFKKFEGILKNMQSLPNVTIRLSSDDITGEKVNSDLIKTNSTILPSELIEGYDGFICPAYKQDGKCLTCKACYNKSEETIAYVAHGVSMRSKIKKLDLVNI